MIRSIRLAAVLALLLMTFSALPGVPQESDPIENGIQAFRAGRLDEAIQIFTAVLESSTASAETRFNAQLNRGSTHLLANHIDEAIADFSAAIAARPEDASLYMSRGTALGRKGDRDAAFADFDRALKIDPKYAEAYFNRARLRIKLRETEQAIRDLTTALRLKPAFSPAAITLANLYSGSGQTDRAVEVLTASLAAADDPYARAARGDLHAGLGRFSAAVDDFSRAIELAPDHVHVYAARGGAFVQLNRMEDALRDFDAALTAEPDDAPVRVDRANVHFIRGESDKAIADYTAALESDDAPAETLFYRGCAYVGTGDLEKAKADLDSHAAKHPEDKYAAIMQFVVAGRLGLASNALHPFREGDPKDWPDEIIRFLSGRTTREAFLASIASATDDAKQRTIEGHYYLGQECLIRKDSDCARRHFQAAKAPGVTMFVEQMGAGAELRRLAVK